MVSISSVPQCVNWILHRIQFNNLLRVATMKIPKLCITAPLEEESTDSSKGFSSQRASNAESISMSWHHHVIFMLRFSLPGKTVFILKEDQGQWVNSLGPSDAIWRWRSWSTLVQVMACCLTAPSHYLNQCWLIISLRSCGIHLRTKS